jgi:hypothetical protein
MNKTTKYPKKLTTKSQENVLEKENLIMKTIASFVEK